MLMQVRFGHDGDGSGIKGVYVAGLWAARRR